MRVMLLIKGDPEPGAMPSQELFEAMGRYNDELRDAGVLLDLAGLHRSGEGKRVRFSNGERAVVDGPFDEKDAVAGTGSSTCHRWKMRSAGRGVRRSKPSPGSTQGSTELTAGRDRARGRSASPPRRRITPSDPVPSTGRLTLSGSPPIKRVGGTRARGPTQDAGARPWGRSTTVGEPKRRFEANLRRARLRSTGGSGTCTSHRRSPIARWPGSRERTFAMLWRRLRSARRGRHRRVSSLCGCCSTGRSMRS
jgi:hypothetical protein